MEQLSADEIEKNKLHHKEVQEKMTKVVKNQDRPSSDCHLAAWTAR